MIDFTSSTRSVASCRRRGVRKFWRTSSVVKTVSAWNLPVRSPDASECVLVPNSFPHLAPRRARVADFRGTHHVLRLARQHDSQERLAAAEAIAVSGIEEIAAEIARPPNRRHRLVVRRPPPSDRY